MVVYLAEISELFKKWNRLILLKQIFHDFTYYGAEFETLAWARTHHQSVSMLICPVNQKALVLSNWVPARLFLCQANHVFPIVVSHFLTHVLKHGSLEFFIRAKASIPILRIGNADHVFYISISPVRQHEVEVAAFLHMHECGKFAYLVFLGIFKPPIGDNLLYIGDQRVYLRDEFVQPMSTAKGCLFCVNLKLLSLRF